MFAFLISALVLLSSTVVLAQDNENVFGGLHGGGYSSGSLWGTSYFNFTVSGLDDVNRGGASWFLYQYLSFNYKFASDQRLALRPAFSTQTAGVYNDRGDTRPLETKLDDFHVTYSNYALANFPGDWDLSGTFYAYFPTSKASQDEKWAARLRSWLIFQNRLNRYWTVTYNFKPEYYVNTQKAYRKTSQRSSPNGQTSTSYYAENNKMAGLEHYVEFSRYVNKIFTPQMALGFKHEWYTDSQEADSKPAVTDRLVVQPSTWVYVNPQLKFIVGLSNSIDIRDRRGEKFELFKEDETSYYLMTFWTLN